MHLCAFSQHLQASYPALVVGGLAASAPLGYYDVQAWAAHGVDGFTWADIVARDYATADPRCLEAIAAAKAAVETLAPAAAVDVFGVCEAAGLGPTTQSDLFVYALEVRALFTCSLYHFDCFIFPSPLAPPLSAAAAVGARSTTAVH